MSSEDERTPILPTLYRTVDGKALRADQPLVKTPDRRDIETYGEVYDVCGTCKYFELAEGQERMRAQKFFERLIRENHWQLRHLAAPENEIGICGAHDSGGGNDQTITAKMHKACDQYRPENGLVTLRRATTDKK